MKSKLILALDKIKEDNFYTLGEISHNLSSKSLYIITIIVMLPFMQPIPIPGVSSLLGIVALFQGLGLCLTGKIILPKKLKAISIKPENFDKFYKIAVKFNHYADKLSYFKHPFVSSRPVEIISGMLIILLAAFLSLPLPVPFSNFIPALAIFLICLGLLEEDLLLLILGYLIALLLIVMLFLIESLIRDIF